MEKFANLCEILNIKLAKLQCSICLRGWLGGWTPQPPGASQPPKFSLKYIADPHMGFPQIEYCQVVWALDKFTI